MKQLAQTADNRVAGIGNVAVARLGTNPAGMFGFLFSRCSLRLLAIVRADSRSLVFCPYAREPGSVSPFVIALNDRPLKIQAKADLCHDDRLRRHRV